MDKDRDWSVVLFISALVMFGFVIGACILALFVMHPIIMIGVFCGLLMFLEYWKKHPWQEKIFITLSIPITIFMLPFDYYQYRTTIKEYIEMYKELYFD